MPDLTQISLFDNLYPKDASPPDNTQIVQTILYHSEPENREFKKLCKLAMKEFNPADYQEKGNISDVLLLLLRKTYGEWNQDR